MLTVFCESAEMFLFLWKCVPNLGLTVCLFFSISVFSGKKNIKAILRSKEDLGSLYPYDLGDRRT